MLRSGYDTRTISDPARRCLAATSGLREAWSSVHARQSFEVLVDGAEIVFGQLTIIRPRHDLEQIMAQRRERRESFQIRASTDCLDELVEGQPAWAATGVGREIPADDGSTGERPLPSEKLDGIGNLRLPEEGIAAR